MEGVFSYDWELESESVDERFAEKKEELQIGEKLVLAGKEHNVLRYRNIVSGSFVLYRLNEKNEKEVYELDADYMLDGGDGLIIRTSNSRIPDFSHSAFYNKRKFNQNDYEKWGNQDFILHANYRFLSFGNFTSEKRSLQIAEKSGYLHALSVYLDKFRGKTLRYLVFGDSISTGAEASTLENTYFGRFAREIERQYGVAVEVINASVGGDTSEDGLKRMEKDVLGHDFQLVTVAFGMNDQNKYGNVLPITPIKFAQNIEKILSLLSPKVPALLVSPCMPNLNWYYSSGRMSEYVEQLSRIAKSRELPFADVCALWKSELESGKTADDLLANGINHPTDYGHYLYSLMLKTLL